MPEIGSPRHSSSFKPGKTAPFSPPDVQPSISALPHFLASSIPNCIDIKRGTLQRILLVLALCRVHFGRIFLSITRSVRALSSSKGACQAKAKVVKDDTLFGMKSLDLFGIRVLMQTVHQIFWSDSRPLEVPSYA
jgi:hypothetical protein